MGTEEDRDYIAQQNAQLQHFNDMDDELSYWKLVNFQKGQDVCGHGSGY